MIADGSHHDKLRIAYQQIVKSYTVAISERPGLLGEARLRGQDEEFLGKNAVIATF